MRSALRTSATTKRRVAAYAADALGQGHPSRPRRSSQDDRRDRAVARLVYRAPRPARRSRRGYRVHRRRSADARRHRAVARANESHSRDRRGQPPRGRRAERDQRRSSAGRRTRRLVLSSRSGQPRVVIDRRQRRGVRGRTTRVQVRHDEAVRAGARSRAADR